MPREFNRGSGMEEFMDPIPVDVGFLSNEEFEFYAAHAGELNYLIEKIFVSEDPSSQGINTANLSIYCFKLGRDFANKRSS